MNTWQVPLLKIICEATSHLIYLPLSLTFLVHPHTFTLPLRVSLVASVPRPAPVRRADAVAAGPEVHAGRGVVAEAVDGDAGPLAADTPDDLALPGLAEEQALVARVGVDFELALDLGARCVPEDALRAGVVVVDVDGDDLGVVVGELAVPVGEHLEIVGFSCDGVEGEVRGLGGVVPSGKGARGGEGG